MCICPQFTVVGKSEPHYELLDSQTYTCMRDKLCMGCLHTRLTYLCVEWFTSANSHMVVISQFE